MRAPFTLTEGGARRGAPGSTPALGADVRPRVAAWLSPGERAQVNGAVGAEVVLTHHDALATVADDLARGEADAVLVSAARVGAADVRRLAHHARGHAAVTFAGIVTDVANDAQALTAAHVLGLAGVRTMLDCRTRGGWAALRAALAPCRACHGADAFRRACVAGVLGAVYGDDEGGQRSDGLARFFALAFAPNVTRVQVLAARLGVCPQTLTSRFYRAGLPSPKQYLTWARLVWAARLGEAPGRSVSTIAELLDASSLQGFGRSVRLYTGLSPSEFRRRFTGASLLDRYRAALVSPHRDRLRTFDPVGEGVPHCVIGAAAHPALRPGRVAA